MHAVYATAKTFSMDIQVKLFGMATDAEAKQVADGKVYKDNAFYYSEMLGRITLVNDHCCLLVDKSQKLFIYSEPEKSELKNKSDEATSAIPDSTLFKGATLRFISQTAEAHVIELKYADNKMYDKIEISIHPTTHHLLRVVYYYATVNGKIPSYAKTDISYKNVQLNGIINRTVFSEKKFVTVTKDKITPLATYVSYEVIDQRRYNQSVKTH
ncbi:MAG: hypothetical protein M3R17_20315 [Bacteroidota bacterium]|nr:hypothetical protein [Bacteroidota bacterium]